MKHGNKHEVPSTSSKSRKGMDILWEDIHNARTEKRRTQAAVNEPQDANDFWISNPEFDSAYLDYEPPTTINPHMDWFPRIDDVE